MKNLLYILIGIAILAGGFFAFNDYIYNEKQGEQAQVVPYQAELSGEFNCLPHISTTGPEAEACAFGIKTAAGEWYALDIPEPLYQGMIARTSLRITVVGLIVPIEQISSDYWKDFPIEGIMKVESFE